MSSPAPDRPIEIRIRNAGQLFHTLDPTPFRERDLDADVADYLIDWASELPRRQPLGICIHMPQDEAQQRDAAEIAQAIPNYFAYRAEQTTRELKELFRFGRTALLIGISVLALCIVTSRIAGRILGEAYYGGLIEQGLVILGWVANWRPLELFLYDWWPLVRRRRLYRRLADASVHLEPD
jgi:hypothetical protein